MPTTRPLVLGSSLGGYRVDALVRESEAGALYHARQPALARSVALYVVNAAPGSGAALDFRRRAQALAGLDHPHLLPVFEVGEAEGRVFAAVQSAPGQRLDELVAQHGALPGPLAAGLASQLGSALDALTEAGAAPARVSAADVHIVEDQAYLMPLQPPAADEARRPQSPQEGLASLLSTMLSGRAEAPEQLPPPLRPMLARADRFGSAVELSRAAGRALLSSSRRRRRRRAVLAGGGAALGAVLLVALATTGQDDDPSRPGGGLPGAPVARVAATIALGKAPDVAPGSALTDAHLLWLSTPDESLLRVDLRRRSVVGAPIRVPTRGKAEWLPLTVGGDAVWFADVSAGTIVKVDGRTGRPLAHVRVGQGVEDLAVADGRLWVSRSGSPRRLRPRRELLRFDVRTLAPLGRPVRVGFHPIRVHAERGRAWVVNAGDGTVTAFDPKSGATKTLVVSAYLENGVLSDGDLWLPNPYARTVTRVDALNMRLVGAAVQLDRSPVSLAATKDAVWVAATKGSDGSGPALLYRIDARTGRLAGHPVRLPDGGPLVAADGALWLVSPARRAVFQLIPTAPAPAPADAPPRPRGRRPLINGPLQPGRWEATRFKVPFAITIGISGWIGDVAGDSVFFRRADERAVTLSVDAPSQIFTPSGDLEPLRRPEQLIDAVTRLPHVRTANRRTTTVAGLRAATVTARALPYRDYPIDLCRAPCVPLYSLPVAIATATIQSEPVDIVAVRRRGRLVTLVKEHDPRTEALVDSIRFR